MVTEPFFPVQVRVSRFVGYREFLHDYGLVYLFLGLILGYLYKFFAFNHYYSFLAEKTFQAEASPDLQVEVMNRISDQGLLLLHDKAEKTVDDLEFFKQSQLSQMEELKADLSQQKKQIKKVLKMQEPKKLK